MKIHTTNYRNTLIEPAEDCPSPTAQIPPMRGENKTLAELQYEMLIDSPYRFTSDEVLFATFALHKRIPNLLLDEARESWFSKGQPCFRASALTKRYGWAVHFNDDMKMALLAPDSAEFARLVADEKLTHLKAMRSRRV